VQSKWKCPGAGSSHSFRLLSTLQIMTQLKIYINFDRSHPLCLQLNRVDPTVFPLCVYTYIYNVVQI
jgi:hypothetical protein